ncbi:cobalamin biosynthesis protein CobQ [Thermosipho sp. 1223]|nr:cobalamin biosynthesis protein CobQ [Thermosipho sp. 1244]OOC46760.1 cobalamin biosynthesis protein CobQ [Thermosipho sp. 1223]
MILMIQGTASNVGKSIISTALCRYFTKKGLDVVPFKAQNISLNSVVSKEEGEMAVAQYVQAVACNKKPSVLMNPILLKPDVEGVQLIVNGKPIKNVESKKYMYSDKKWILDQALKALYKLLEKHELVIIEGSGSAAEINIKDISNMAIAKAVNAPVILISNIEMGGAFAQIAGAMVLFGKFEKSIVKGFIFNKFRGDKSVLGDSPKKFGERFNLKYFGTVEYFKHYLPEEDLFFEKEGIGDLKVDILKLPHISNSFEFEPLFLNTNAKFVENIREDVDLVIIPGTKSTIFDLEWIKQRKDQINGALLNGAFLLGICGGYQMLGKKIVYNGKCYEGLGYLNLKTIFLETKILRNIVAKEMLFNTDIEGFEIHHGRTISHESPFLLYDNGKLDGAIKGRIFGGYTHNLFKNKEFLKKFLNYIRKNRGYNTKDLSLFTLEEEIDRVSDYIIGQIDIKEIENVIGL